MTETGAADAGDERGITRGQWRVIIVSSLGGALEFYDFIVYSVFAQYIGRAFFPAEDPLVSLMLSFGTFAVGYLARPIGGIVLGHFGDRYGRRRVFIFSILLMTVATIAMGLLPTYAQAGIIASLLMVLLRIVQGFCVGGELPGAITYVVETVPRKATFAAGVIFFCVNTGVALAALLNVGLQAIYTPEEVATFGWRAGFLFGGFLGLIGFLLRLSLEESKQFMRKADAPAPIPMLELMRKFPLTLLVSIAAIAATCGFNGYLFSVSSFFPEAMDYTAAEAGGAQLLGLMVASFGLLFVAWLGDRIPRRNLLAAGAAMMLVGAWPFYAAAESGMNIYVLLALAGLVGSLFNGVFAGILGDLYPARIRFSGIATSLNLGMTIFSGFGPLVATWLTAQAGGDARAASLYIMGCAVLTLIGAYFLRSHQGWAMHDAGVPNTGPNRPKVPLTSASSAEA